jgi:hypothetical protein
MADAGEVLGKLRDPSAEGATARLAALVVEEGLGRTLRELIDLPTAVAGIEDALKAFTASDAAAARIVELLTEADRTASADTRKVRDVVAPALQAGARELAQVAGTPPHDVVVRLLDREPLKKLLRAQVIDTLIAFGKRAASPVSDNPLARGLGGLSKLAMGQASKPSAFGALASAVSGEVERQVEKRATDFADTAVAGILEGIADQIADPARAKDQAAMRLALLDGLLALTGAEVASLVRGPVAERVAVARKALAAWSATPAFASEVETIVKTVLAKDLDRSLGDVLADFGLREVVASRAKAHVHQRVVAFVAGEPFAEWLRAVLA